MNFEEIMKSKGWTDADLADPTLKTILDRLRPVVESAYGEVESLRGEFDSYRKEAEEVWTPAANQRITAAEKEAVEARRRAADLQEQLKIAKDYGLLPTEDPKPTPPALDVSPSAFDPKAHKLVTYDDVATLANREGEAIAMSHDLNAEYNYLTGKQLFDYTGTDGKRGMQALLAEARASRKGLDVYVAEKFRFADLRQAKQAEVQKAHDDAIRREEAEKVRAELAGQYGNPLMRAPVPSRTPFIPPKGNEGQPWEKTDAQLRNARIERAMKTQLAGKAQ